MPSLAENRSCMVNSAVSTPKAKKLPLLIFDFDGTLAQTLETGVDIFNDVCDAYGLKPVTMEEVRELRNLHTRALLDHLGISRLMAVKLAAHVRRLLHRRMHEVKVVSGIKEAIRELHEEGFPMGILSSNAAENVRIFLERNGMSDCFRFIEAGVSLFGKTRRIRNVLRQENVAAEKAMYVGDETRDMEASRRAGVCALGVCWGTNGREAILTEGPEFCVEKPPEMVAAAREFAAGNTGWHVHHG